MKKKYPPIDVAISSSHVQHAWPLLNALPFPVLEIGEDFEIQKMNSAAQEEYGAGKGACYRLTHGYEAPCDKHGEPCPKYEAEQSGQSVAVLHVHQTSNEIERYKVAAVPLDGGGVIEFHVPLDDVKTIDHLTGLPNRTDAEQTARRYTTLMRRMGGGYSLILVDLDHLKQANDTFGHAVGDRVLQAAGQILQNSVRETDLAGRWGGDEFLILLPGNEPSRAEQLAMRIIGEVDSIAIMVGDAKVRVSASAGIRCVSTNEAKSIEFTQALADADHALYRAKDAGRNCFVVYSE